MTTKAAKISQTSILKINKKEGHRALQKGEQWDKYTFGNHVRTSAKVGNILQHVSYAATDNVPYLISTYSRYNAFRKERKNVAGMMSKEHHVDKKGIANKMADRIRKGESEHLMKFAMSTDVPELKDSRNSDDVVAYLNTMKIFGQSGGLDIEKYINYIITDIQEMFFRYSSATGLGASVVDVATASMVSDNPNITMESDSLKNTAYRKSEEETLKRYEGSSHEVFNMLSSNELEMNDLLTVSLALSFMYRAGMQAVNQIEGAGYRSQDEFMSLHSEFRSAITKLENRIQSDTIGFKNNRRAFGHLAEIIVGYSASKALNQAAEASNEILKQAHEGGKKAREGANTFITEVASGRKEAQYKGADLILKSQKSFDGKTITTSISIDNKQTGYKRNERAGGFIYDSSVTVDLKPGFDEILKSNTASSRTMKLYRSMVLNIAASEGYNLIGNPEEREMIAQQAVFNEETFGNKFSSEKLSEITPGHTYPLVASLNGRFHPFSEVVRAMGDEETFKAEFTGSKGFQIANATSINAGKLYQTKIDTGRGKSIKSGAVSKKFNKQKHTQPRTIAGFAAKMSMMEGLVSRIENGYFNSNSKKQVRMTIVLR